MRHAIRWILAALVVAGCGGGTGPGGGGGALSIQAVSNSAQGNITAGSTAPVTLVAKVTNSSGSAVSGTTVSWSTSSGTVSPASTTSDGNGQASIQWTLGTVAGAQTAVATISGVAGGATFSATVTAAALAKIKVSPDTLKMSVAGDTARASATGADAFDNPVTVSAVTFTTDNPAIATVNSVGLVTAQAPGSTFIRATAGAATGSTVASVKTPPCFGNAGLSLQVGQVSTLTGTAAAEFCLKGASGAEFVAIPFFEPTNGSALSLVFDPISTTAALGPPSPNISSNLRLRPAILSDGRELTRNDAWEENFRDRSRREMTPLIGAAQSAMQQSPIGLRRSVSFAVSSVGDIVSFNVNTASGCTTPTFRAGRVMAVSNKAIVVNDTLNPSGANGFTDADFQFIAATFDTLVYPVDTSNFGAPTDIDNNGHVYLFFTSAVNALTSPGAPNGFIGGFFFNRDLFPTTATSRAQACPTSNFAEMFYLLTPDPNGTVNGNKFSVSTVRTLTIGTVAHEFQHLINASRHLYINLGTTAFEEVFLDEGLAHEAEELTFYRASGLNPGQNLDAAALTATQRTVDAANNFAIQNERRFREYLKATEANSPYSPNDALATRGATWSFLRYAVDRSGTSESNIWFNLVNPNVANMTGLANLSRVFGFDLTSQIRDYMVANYTDDAVAGVPAINTHPSWNTRSIETFVNSNVFPLATRQMPAGAKLSFSLLDGGAGYVRFGVPALSVGGAALTSAAGPLPSTFSLSIVRTK